MEEHDKKGVVLALAVGFAIVVVVLAVWGPSYVGYATLEDLDDLPAVTGSEGGSLRFEEVPHFKVYVGDKVRIKIQANREAKFTDDTDLFNITEDGIIEFDVNEEDVGYYRTVIIAKNEESVYFQDLRIKIEE
ncbi:hypothetical protein ACFL0V_01615 [Nanoarchaeota archaeon]